MRWFSRRCCSISIVNASRHKLAKKRQEIATTTNLRVLLLDPRTERLYGRHEAIKVLDSKDCGGEQIERVS